MAALGRLGEPVGLPRPPLVRVPRIADAVRGSGWMRWGAAELALLGRQSRQGERQRRPSGAQGGGSSLRAPRGDCIRGDAEVDDAAATRGVAVWQWQGQWLPQR